MGFCHLGAEGRNTTVTEIEFATDACYAYLSGVLPKKPQAIGWQQNHNNGRSILHHQTSLYRIARDTK
jgi:hypothetical protein